MTPEALADAGWVQLKPKGFSAVAGPIWSHGDGDELRLAFRAGEQHGNLHRGSVHGGMLLTFADIALGYGVMRAIGGRNCVTAQLQMQFVASAREGDLIVCQPQIVRRSTQLVFVRGLLSVDERTVASADGIWKILHDRSE